MPEGTTFFLDYLFREGFGFGAFGFGGLGLTNHFFSKILLGPGFAYQSLTLKYDDLFQTVNCMWFTWQQHVGGLRDMNFFDYVLIMAACF